MADSISGVAIYADLHVQENYTSFPFSTYDEKKLGENENIKRYDYVVKNYEGDILASKIHGQDAIINNPVEALEVCLKIIANS